MNASKWLLISCLLPAASPRAQQGPHPETQKIVFENELVRVLDILVPPGVFEPEHSHARGVTIAVSDYDNETKSVPQGRVSTGHDTETRTWPEGTVSRNRSTKGAVRWSEPVMHDVRNIGTTATYAIRIDVK